MPRPCQKARSSAHSRLPNSGRLPAPLIYLSQMLFKQVRAMDCSHNIPSSITHNCGSSTRSGVSAFAIAIDWTVIGIFIKRTRVQPWTNSLHASLFPCLNRITLLLRSTQNKPAGRSSTRLQGHSQRWLSQEVLAHSPPKRGIAGSYGLSGEMQTEVVATAVGGLRGRQRGFASYKRLPPREPYRTITYDYGLPNQSLAGAEDPWNGIAWVSCR